MHRLESFLFGADNVEPFVRPVICAGTQFWVRVANESEAIVDLWAAFTDAGTAAHIRSDFAKCKRERMTKWPLVDQWEEEQFLRPPAATRSGV